MNTLLKVAIFPMLLAMFALAGCEVEKTEEGEMPRVDVEGGNLPEYDVDAPDVEVGTETKEIEVPTVDIEMPEDDDEIAEDDDLVDQEETVNR